MPLDVSKLAPDKQRRLLDLLRRYKASPATALGFQEGTPSSLRFDPPVAATQSTSVSQQVPFVNANQPPAPVGNYESPIGPEFKNPAPNPLSYVEPFATLKRAASPVTGFLADRAEDFQHDLSQLPQPQSPESDVRTPQNEAFDQMGPIAQGSNEIARLGLGYGGGIFSFLTGLPDKIVNPEKYAPEGSTSPGLDVLKQEGVGLMDMIGNVPAQVGHVVGGVTRAPIDDYMRKLYGEEGFKNAINSLYTNPETLAFGTQIGAGLGRGAFKAGGRLAGVDPQRPVTRQTAGLEQPAAAYDPNIAPSKQPFAEVAGEPVYNRVKTPAIESADAFIEAAKTIAEGRRQRQGEVTQKRTVSLPQMTQQDAAVLEGPGAASQRVSAEFVSPSIIEGKDLSRATKDIDSPRQAQHKAIFDDVDARMGHKAESSSGIGVWSDGAENTIISLKEGDIPFDEIRYSVAQKGISGNQKAVLAFQESTDGQARLYRIEIPKEKGKRADIIETLDLEGVEFKTITEGPGHTSVFVFSESLDNVLKSSLNRVGDKYDVGIQEYQGVGGFIGAESRIEGLSEYRRIIADFERAQPNRQYERQGSKAQRRDSRRRSDAQEKEVSELGFSTEKPPSKQISLFEPPPAPEVKASREQGKIQGLNKAEQDRIRQETGLSELDPAERRGWEETLSRAKADKYDVSALVTAEAILGAKRPRTITDVEHAGMVLESARLVDEYDLSIKTANELIEKGDLASAKHERSQAETTLEQIDKLTEASRMGRRETARALSIGRMMVNRETYDLAHVMQRAQVAKGSKLSSKETGKIESLVAAQKSLQEKLKQSEAEYEKVAAERDRLAAEVITKRVARRAKSRIGTEKARRVVINERADIKKQLASLGYRLNDVTGVTAEGAYLVGKLAVSYIKERSLTLSEVVKQVRNDLPELTERDVYESLIARDPTLQRKARGATQTRIRHLKTQARLLLDIEKAERGVFDLPKHTKPQPLKIRLLQRQLTKLRSQAYKSGAHPIQLERAIKTINELQDQLANQYRLLRLTKRPGQTAELAAAREKIQTLRKEMRVEDELARLDEQLRTGEFEIKERPAPKEVPVDLERRQILLKRKRREIRAAIDDMAPVTPGKVFVEAVNTARTLKATADMSATLRQGLILSARRPQAAFKAFGKSFKATFSRYTAEQVDHAIQSAPHHYIREKSKLYLSPFESGRASAREEMFMSRFAEKVPAVGAIVKASERHMTTYLNLMRTAAFDQFLEKNPNATHVELKAWADFVNAASGRGDLGRFAGAANVMSLGIFAPRFAVSRFQTPYKLVKHWEHPRVRKEIARDLAAVAGLGATALYLAHLGGAEVSLDPRSPDWGKIKIGDTRIDIWGGFQQPARLITRIGLGISDKTGITGDHLTASEKNINPLELAWRFSSYKAAPSVTLPIEFFRGRTIVGEEVAPSETALRAVTPMVYEDILDAWKSGGPSRALLATGLGFFGVGVSTYESKQRNTRSVRSGRTGRR